MIRLKSEEEIKIMREAGKIVAETHELLKSAIIPGVSTLELDTIAEENIRKYNAVPSFKGYGGFKGSICASINNEVVHGIPGNKIVKEGDIISIDIGAYYKGYHGDAAKTHAVGVISEDNRKLIEVTRQSFYEGIKFAKIGYRLSDISHAIQTYVEQNGFSVVKAGMVLTIEPMVNMGKFNVKCQSDGWTIVTIDGKNSAHYEHTIVITENEPILLTSL